MCKIINEIREVKSYAEANKLLEDGWRLYSVNTSSPCTTYIMIKFGSNNS